jgi:4'-phosphopantetheinyl transferase EntD
MPQNTFTRRPSAFDALLPLQVVTIEATPAMWESGLYSEEKAYVATAVERRRREFTAGRNCARVALRMLGVEACPIPVGSRRAPVFPAGISGTITHTNDYCAASVALHSVVGSIGIDAESNTPLSPGVHSLIMGSDELASIAGLPRHNSVHWDTLVFSAKEAFYKASFRLCKVELDFLDVHVTVLPDDGWYELRLLRFDLPNYFTEQRFVGRYVFDAHRVYTAMVLPNARGLG